ncbi:MAG: beta-ketoacyl-ACP synthase [Ramlibacter sp.]|jgi:3-oxoacyl-[acyl-carrier-protein] synthase-1|nr:beta-ketoacyl-ACP synthase [Ramlibacter sp.]
MNEIHLNAVGVISALGEGVNSLGGVLDAVMPQSVRPTDRYTPGRALHLGCVNGALPSLAHLEVQFEGRVNALAAAAFAQIRLQVEAARERFGPERIAVVLGVSTAGLGEGHQAAQSWQAGRGWPSRYHYAQQEMGTTSRLLALLAGAQGPAYGISTACSSGAKALAAAARLLKADLADVVIAGGVDALCSFTVEGFSALESVSAKRCNPMSRNREGINIGEGAALFLVSREPGPVRLAGWGETSDAHHMSAPHPEGAGAAQAMQQALARAGIAAHRIDYVNLHGTATRQNDAMESRAVQSVLGTNVPVSSTKPLTGHALAAAGAIEAAICWATLVGNPQGRLPVHWWDSAADPELSQVPLVGPGHALGREPAYLMSNSFAFGGSNACLVFSGG